jgi:hypothetical protein
MAKKIKIDIDFNQDNVLIAISCHKKDYWLAFQINETLQLQLRRMKDFGFYHTSDDQILEYPIYHYIHPQTSLSWYLISNYHPDGKLFPSLRTTDFFMLLNGSVTSHDTDHILQNLKRIKGVLHAHQLETKNLKEIGNFLSDLELHMIECLKA